jgi:hypothetical protein
MAPRLVPVAVVGPLAGAHVVTGYRWCEAGRLGQIRYDGRRRCVRVDALEAFLGRPISQDEIDRARAALNGREKIRHRMKRAETRLVVEHIHRKETRSERRQRDYLRFAGTPGDEK